jgi:cytochrome c oxidase subunit 2
MFDYGKIVTKAQFETWATTTEAKLAPNTKLLPAYALTYTPDANGADGGYYPDCPASAPSPAYACDPYSGVQTYGATPAKS